VDEARHSDEAGHSDFDRSTEEYPPSTEEYSPSTAEYPWWESLGFGSLREYLDSFEEQQRRLDPLRTPRLAPVPEPLSGLQTPGQQAFDLSPPQRADLRIRQVSIKLTPSEHEELVRVATSYGMPASTMARVLVIRGIRAVLEAEAPTGPPD
jgi:hypothetical protein